MNDENTVRIPRGVLMKIYSDVDAFRQMVSGDILEKTGTLYMTDGYEGLDAVCGTIGSLLDAPGYLKLTVASQTAREKLRDAYGKASACAANALPETDLQQACLSLCSCFYAALNDVYDPGTGSDNSIGRVMEASQYCMDMLDGIEAAGRESFVPFARDPGGAMPHDFMDAFRGAAGMLQPRYDPEKNDIQKEEHA